MDAPENTEKDDADVFMAFLRKAGFTGCPVCKNEHGFTWAHSAHIPGLGDARITAHLPGTTTIPGTTPEKTEHFPTPLLVLICDRCTHLMTFSKTMFLLKAAKNGG